MPTLALSLQEPASGNVRGWWNRLETQLGLRGIRRVPFPHVTLLGFEGIPFPIVQDLLEARCELFPPLCLHAAGVGLFLQPRPVLYLSIVRSPLLSALHRSLWEGVADHQGVLDPLHGPERWIPHVTLAQGDLTLEHIPKMLEILNEDELCFDFEVRNVTLYDWIGPRYEPRERYPLRGRTSSGPGAILGA